MIPTAIWAPIATVASGALGFLSALVGRRHYGGPTTTPRDSLREDARYLDQRLTESRKELDNCYQIISELRAENLRLREINDKTTVHAVEVGGVLHELAEKGLTNAQSNTTQTISTTPTQGAPAGGPGGNQS